jgi:hypothetical protein
MYSGDRFMDKFNKITVGFVVQQYEKNDNGELVCVSQEFVAGDQVDYEDVNGEPLKEVPNHKYQPFNMTLK